MKVAASAAAALAASLVLAGCGSDSDELRDDGGSVGAPNESRSRSPTPAASPRSSTCRPGPTTFKVTNDGAGEGDASSRCSTARILGEVENIAPGLSGEFSLTLKPGDYTTLLPRRHEPERGTLDGHRRRRPPRAPHGDGGASPPTARYVEQQTAELVDRTTQVRRRGQGRQRREGEGALRRSPACPTSGSSRWPRASATSTPRSTRARATSPPQDWTGFHPHRAGALGRRHDSTGMAPARRPARRRTSQLLDTRRRDVEPRAGADRQRRGRAARRGVEVEDHRRGGALLAHRPRRLRGERRRARRPRSTPCSRRREEGRRARRRDRRALRRRDRRARPVPHASPTATSLHRADDAHDTRELSQAIDALAEPLSKVRRDRRRLGPR